MKRLNVWKFATATALTLGILSAMCAVAVIVAPDATIAVFNSWMHGVDLTRLVPAGGRPVTFGQVIAGIVSLGVIGFGSGAFLSGVYNMMAGRDSDEPVVRATRRSV